VTARIDAECANIATVQSIRWLPEVLGHR
jgi:hypothetical protein